MRNVRSDVLHVDLDAFYVSVERRKSPDLDGIAVIVGGDGNRGVVLSCSYEARAKGVRNGIPSVRARRLCPNAVFVRPDFESYTKASKDFRGILDAITPRVEPVSLDEAFCDVSGAHRLFGSSEAIADAVRERVRTELGLTCSVGGGVSKLVAKVASRACKPDGVLIVTDPVAFLHPRPVEDLWGVGEVTAAALRHLGITTIGDLARTPRAVLRGSLGEAGAAHLGALFDGRDPSPVDPRADARSVGAEKTFERDLADDEEIEAELLRMADRVSSRLSKSGRTARTITVKIRLADFAMHTRSRTLGRGTDDVWTIFATARDAYRAFRRGRRSVRLIGVSASGLAAEREPEQLTFDRRPRYEEAEQALTRVRRRFGDGALRLARLVRSRRADV